MAPRSRWWKFTRGQVLWVFTTVVVLGAGVQWLQLSHREIVLGPFSPQGDAFVCYEFARHQAARLVRMSIRDSRTGDMLADLTQFQLQHQIAWAPDGDSLLGLVRNRRDGSQARVCQLRWRPELDEVRSWEVADARQVYFDAAGRARVIRHPAEGAGGRRLEFPVLGALTEPSTLRLGAYEQAYVYPALTHRWIFVAIAPTPMGAASDYLWTNGQTRVLLQVDGSTGQVRRQLAGDWSPLEYGTSLVWRHDSVTQRMEVARVEATDLPIALCPHRWMPFAETPAGILFRGPANEVRYQGFSTTQLRVVRQPDWGWLSSSPQMFEQVRLATPRTLAVAHRGRMELWEVDAAKRSVVLDTRRGLYLWQAIAWGGLPLVALGWWVLPRPRHLTGYAEVALWSVVLAAIVVLWTSLGMGGFMPRSWYVVIALAMMTASLLYFFVWLSLDRDHWLHRLSVTCVISAATLNVMLLWMRDADGRELEDGLIGGVLTLLAVCLGALLLPRVSSAVRRAQLSLAAVSQRHVTLWQVLAFLAALGLLLAQLQFVQPSGFTVLGEPARVVWLMGLAVWMAALAWSAAWSAWAWSHTAVSFLSCMVSCGIVGGAHFAFAREFQLMVQWDEPRRYGFSLLVVIWVWLSMRIVGWRAKSVSVEKRLP